MILETKRGDLLASSCVEDRIRMLAKPKEGVAVHVDAEGYSTSI